MITTCSPMIRQFFDTMIVSSRGEHRAGFSHCSFSVIQQNFAPSSVFLNANFLWLTLTPRPGTQTLITFYPARYPVFCVFVATILNFKYAVWGLKPNRAFNRALDIQNGRHNFLPCTWVTEVQHRSTFKGLLFVSTVKYLMWDIR